MTDPLPAPPASDTPESHADWLELKALREGDNNSSFQDLVQELRRTGSTDGLDVAETNSGTADSGSELSHVVAEEMLGEISDRLAACARLEGVYSFEVHEQYIQARSGHEESMYTFLLLLSYFGKDAGPQNINAVKLFNSISAHAGREYFGGRSQGVRSYIFDFPRDNGPKNFPDALDDLCREMAEGAGYKDHPTGKDQKDAKLDIAIWRPFEDGRVGKLIAFGQCATGNGWPEKLRELQPLEFVTWMINTPPVMPIKLFFTPFRAESKKWDKTSVAGGILFDRCRIAGLTGGIDAGLQQDCERWTRFVIRHKLS